MVGLPRGSTGVRLKTSLPHSQKCLSDCLWENSTLPTCPQDGPPSLDSGDAGRPAGGGDGAAAHADHVPPAQASPLQASPLRPPPRARLSSTHRLSPLLSFSPFLPASPCLSKRFGVAQILVEPWMFHSFSMIYHCLSLSLSFIICKMGVINGPSLQATLRMQ